MNMMNEYIVEFVSIDRELLVAHIYADSVEDALYAANTMEEVIEIKSLVEIVPYNLEEFNDNLENIKNDELLREKTYKEPKDKNNFEKYLTSESTIDIEDLIDESADFRLDEDEELDLKEEFSKLRNEIKRANKKTLKELKRPSKMKLRNVISQIQGLHDEHREIWLERIMNEFAQEEMDNTYLRGYKQGKIDKESDIINENFLVKIPILPKYMKDYINKEKVINNKPLRELLSDIETVINSEGKPVIIKDEKVEKWINENYEKFVEAYIHHN